MLKIPRRQYAMSSGLVVFLPDAHDILCAILALKIPSLHLRMLASIFVIFDISFRRSSFVPKKNQSPLSSSPKKSTCFGATSSWRVHPHEVVIINCGLFAEIFDLSESSLVICCWCPHFLEGYFLLLFPCVRQDSILWWFGWDLLQLERFCIEQPHCKCCNMCCLDLNFRETS
jgi:hypothetical protein